MVKYNEIPDNEDLDSFYKIENIQNTESVALNKNNQKFLEGFRFNNDILLNGQLPLIDFKEITGSQEYNKMENK